MDEPACEDKNVLRRETVFGYSPSSSFFLSEGLRTSIRFRINYLKINADVDF
jgi:hypothetical protein